MEELQQEWYTKCPEKPKREGTQAASTQSWGLVKTPKVLVLTKGQFSILSLVDTGAAFSCK